MIFQRSMNLIRPYMLICRSKPRMNLDLRLSERDITLTMATDFRILSPRFLKDAQDHHPTKELTIDSLIGPSERVGLTRPRGMRTGSRSADGTAAGPFVRPAG